MKRILASAIMLAFALTACGGHGGAGAVTPSVSGSQPASFEWGSAALQGARLIGPAQFSHLQVNVAVSLQDGAGLLNYARETQDPSSPTYHQWLTPQQIGARFGASQQTYDADAAYFEKNGLAVAGWPQHLILSVAGSQPSMERAFGTRFGLYEKNNQQFLAPMSSPSLPSTVAVSAVQNLVTLTTRHRYLIVPPPTAVAAYDIGYSPQQIQNAFDYEGAYKAGYDGTNITVGIVGTGPINVPVGPSPSCGDADAQQFQSIEHLARMANVCEEYVTASGVSSGLATTGIPTAAPGTTPNPLATESPNPGQSPSSMFPYSGDFATPPPLSATCGTSLPACNNEDGEAQLDTQQIASLAPGANVTFYLAYNASDCATLSGQPVVFYPTLCATAPPSPNPLGNYGAPQIGIAEADPEVEQAIADDAVDVLSLSYGGGEMDNIGYGYNGSGIGFEPEEFAALEAEGVAVFVSSGDNGSEECSESVQCVSYPASDPNVASVGGVNAPLNAFGGLTAPITGWGTATGLGDAQSGESGGGVSNVFTAPAWQQNDISATMREQPDVSLIGDPQTAVAIFVNSTDWSSNLLLTGGAQPIGGTSVAAPEMAAMWALVLQANCVKHGDCNSPTHAYRLGNAASYFYSIYKSAAYAKTFYDVLYGSNAMCSSGSARGGCATPVPGFSAGTGYDEITGIGVPYAGHLIDAVVNPTVSVP